MVDTRNTAAGSGRSRPRRHHHYLPYPLLHHCQCWQHHLYLLQTQHYSCFHCHLHPTRLLLDMFQKLYLHLHCLLQQYNNFQNLKLQYWCKQTQKDWQSCNCFQPKRFDKFHFHQFLPLLMMQPRLLLQHLHLHLLLHPHMQLRHIHYLHYIPLYNHLLQLKCL